MKGNEKSREGREEERRDPIKVKEKGNGVE